MAITPLDLQVLFSQIDNIAKDIHAQREGVQLHRLMEASSKQKKDAKKLNSVQEADNAGKELTNLKDRRGADSQEKERKRKKDSENAEQDLTHPKLLDPNLGNYVDICG
ncbi:MAG: hypothetical protein LBD07_04910 [Spirochaetaceae bacterium]|jgi:hypothetical protein|nr:hypothetical protein [Spirochaetaceae bacterium]